MYNVSFHLPVVAGKVLDRIERWKVQLLCHTNTVAFSLWKEEIVTTAVFPVRLQLYNYGSRKM
jgi:hypothetical protein